MSGEARAYLIWISFLLTTAVVIQLGGDSGLRRFDLALLAASLGAMAAAFVWLLEVAWSRSRRWVWVLVLGLAIPYLNLVLASVFARRYWSQGARAPGLLGLSGLAGQVVLSIRLLEPSLPALV